MFTGLIQEMGRIDAVTRKADGASLRLRTETLAASARIGDSIAVNGVCLTVVKRDDTTLSFDLSHETVRTTNLGRLKAGDRVNLEPALRFDSKIGGHFVTGHVDAVGTIRSRSQIGDMWRFEIEAPREVMRYVVEKGSVAVDGISLTVVDILNDGFSLVIIPHTAKVTTMGFKGPGDSVNIETDILGKYVAKLLAKDSDRDERFLRALSEGGFLGR